MVDVIVNSNLHNMALLRRMGLMVGRDFTSEKGAVAKGKPNSLFSTVPRQRQSSSFQVAGKMTGEKLGLNPAFPHLVWVEIAGHMMSEPAQDQRDALCEWFLRAGVEETDMDSVYTNKLGTQEFWKASATHMVFAFKDPQKAMQFKLAWG